MTPRLRTLTFLAGTLAGTLVIAAGPLSPTGRVAIGQRRPLKIFARITSAAGTPIVDLAPGEFTLMIGSDKATIQRASLVKEPTRVVLLVDTSEVASDSLNHIRSGLLAFFDALPAADEVGIVGIGRQARVRVEPTTDRARLRKEAEGLFVDGGSTVLLDALRESYNRFLLRLENRTPMFVIVAGNGGDSSGTRDTEWEAFIRQIQEANVVAHAIMMSTTQGTYLNSKAYTAALNVTKYTGGIYDSVAVTSALPGRLTVMAEHIKQQEEKMAMVYEVDFVSNSKLDVAIELHVPRPGATVALFADRPFK